MKILVLLSAIVIAVNCQSKTGLCPAPESIEAPQRKNCDSDSECKDDLKCCPTQSFHTCSKPCFLALCKCREGTKQVQIVGKSGCPMCSCVNATISNENKNPCMQPKEVGNCKGSFNRFYFDAESRKCMPFVYGGCNGNENNFISLEFCKFKCLADSVKTKEVSIPKSVCSLDKQVGVCRAVLPRFFFNLKTKKCESFTYGGCGGNGNNFLTEDECQKTCNDISPVQNTKTEQSSNAICSLDREIGKCKAAFRRFYFNKTSNKCEEFSYGGCGGNENNFNSREDCEKLCPPVSTVLKQSSSNDVCSLDKDIGPCRGAIPRFFFNKQTKKCEEFSYGGCLGNENNFKNAQECNSKCSSNNICELEKDQGPCRATLDRFYFNKSTQKCEKFTYGGCLGNENNFESESECSKKCSSNSKRIILAQNSKCSQKFDIGACKLNVKRYFYNSTSNTCEEFIYGGCLGSENNFETKSECSLSCVVKPDVCTLQKDVGPCRAAVKRFFFNQNTKQCEEFIFGGCQGNENNFKSQSECQEKCSSNSVSQAVQDNGICSLKKEQGPCRGAFKKFFFNPATNKCEQFIYGGCQGNENNFENETDCLKRCGSSLTKPVIEQASNKCNLPMDVGPCFAAFQRYFYNPTLKRCQQFTYGGCQGNANNFKTEEECKSECVPKLSENKCEQPLDVGPCMAAFKRYFYNSTTKSCEEFIFGGCQGNKNNFESKDVCQKECLKQVQASKPGTCPKPKGFGICVTMCKSDLDCSGDLKCCNNGCGQVCTKVN